MNNPKISVIVVYNKEEGLYDCIQSALKQSFSNIEVICVNNGAKDNAENIAKKLAQKIDRIKLISLPLGVSNEAAKRAGFFVSNGKFVIFIENNEILKADFIKNKYLELQEEKKIELKNKYLYRRTFIENEREISSLVNEVIKKELSLYSGFIEEQKQKISEEFDKFNKNNIEFIQSKTYEIIQRFEALEKLFFDADLKYNKKIEAFENEFKNSHDEKINNINEDIKKLYNHINSNIDKKDEEINSVNEEISKNHKYADEKLKSETKVILENIEKLENRLNWNEKDIYTRYVNLKRIMDIQFDEIRARLG